MTNKSLFIRTSSNKLVRQAGVPVSSFKAGRAGSNRSRLFKRRVGRPTSPERFYIIIIFIMAVLLTCSALGILGKVMDWNKPIALISPVSAFEFPKISITPTIVPKRLDIDIHVARYSQKYSKTDSQLNHTKQLLHCLLFREAGYGLNKNHGDNGLAGGPLQFHEATWVRMRKQMINSGLVTKVGSRYDVEQAIETAAWAISKGRAVEWGPYMRGECK